MVMNDYFDTQKCKIKEDSMKHYRTIGSTGSLVKNNEDNIAKIQLMKVSLITKGIENDMWVIT